ncbi:MAG: hypothetical protein GX756_06500 [Clostridiales bacterium]|nr:hypothetical protein [Clostridiales bacterium]
MDNRQSWAEQKLSEMSIEQKVGQLMVFGASGPIVTPHVCKLIDKYHVGGFRVTQKFFHGSSEAREIRNSNYPLYDIDTIDRSSNMNTKRIACTSKEYAITLNTYRDRAMQKKGAVGLHFTYDQEGEGADLLFEKRLFPYPMGLAATGDLELTERAYYCAGIQAKAMGLNMIHSPVMDVNTNPNNPEIGPRAYSDKADVAAKYGLASLKGYKRAGIICTAKHFPGRGDSDEDAHFGLPVITLGRDELFNNHILAFKALIDGGVDAIMAAFTAYTAFGDDDIPAATNYEIMTKLLREELGFEGVVTTDNVQMKGLTSKYELSEAVIHCINAGCDLVLFRSESPATIYLIEKVLQAVKDKVISYKRLDEAVLRILKMRYDMGLHINGGIVDVEKADMFNDEDIIKTSREAAERSTIILKNSGLLPVSKNAKILLIEQAHHFHCFINNMYSHPGLLYEEMRKHNPNVSLCLINELFDEYEAQAALNRINKDDYDVLVMTSYYNYRSHACMIPLIDKIKYLNKKLLIVSNTPYKKFGVPEYIENAIVSFCPSGREGIAAVADAIFGNIECKAKLDITL